MFMGSSRPGSGRIIYILKRIRLYCQGQRQKWDQDINEEVMTVIWECGYGSGCAEKILDSGYISKAD